MSKIIFDRKASVQPRHDDELDRVLKSLAGEFFDEEGYKKRVDSFESPDIIVDRNKTYIITVTIEELD